MTGLVHSDLFTPRLKKEYCYTPTPHLVQSVQFSVRFTFQHPGVSGGVFLAIYFVEGKLWW